MKIHLLLLITALVAALHVQAAPSEIVYQTGFEPPAFTADQPLTDQNGLGPDGWFAGWFSPATADAMSVSAVNARSGAQCLRFAGGTPQGAAYGNIFAFHPLFDRNDPSFDTGSGFESPVFPGTPGFVARVVLQPDGKLLVTGGFGTFNGVLATGIIRLQPDGTLDPTFRLGGADAIAGGVNGGAAVALLPDGDILVPLSDNVSFLRNDPINYRGLFRLNGDSDCDDDDRRDHGHHDRDDRHDN